MEDKRETQGERDREGERDRDGERERNTHIVRRGEFENGYRVKLFFAKL